MCIEGRQGEARQRNAAAAVVAAAGKLLLRFCTCAEDGAVGEHGRVEEV